MGNKSSKNNLDTINWNNINTEDVSSSIHYLKNISKDAQELVSRLRTNNKYLNKTEIDNFQNLYISNKNNDTDYSKTSPFISSEMYNYLIENSSENNLQQGGANKKTKKNKKAETSSTDDDKTKTSESSDIDLAQLTDDLTGDLTDSSMDIDDTIKEDMETNNDGDTLSLDEIDDDGMEDTNDEANETEMAEEAEEFDDNIEEKEEEDEDEEDEEDMMEGGGINYTSSSAHTSESSNYDTTVSVGNNRVLSDSIRTSDINMVSIEK